MGFGPAPTPPTSYMFIDGESLSQALAKLGEAAFGGITPPLRWDLVRGVHRKVFYFDAIPVQRREEDSSTYEARVEPKRRELAKIERQDGYHVRTGDARHRRRRGNEQKMVDVQLAVDALLMASRGLFSSCTLVTGDLDFRPLVVALVDMGVDVRLLYPPEETSEELLAAADRVSPLTLANLEGWIDPDFEPRRNLPTAWFEAQDSSTAQLDGLVAWDDQVYGRCSVIEDGRGGLHLLTERASAPGHRLRIEGGPHPELLRAVAKLKFDLTVPAW